MQAAEVHFVPLHIPSELEMIRDAQHSYSNVPQFACFDTTFYRTMPVATTTYRHSPPTQCHRRPFRYREVGVQRYCFHGISYESIVSALALNVPAHLVAAHLGNGASLCGLQNGRSIDTSMGMTLTGGTPISTRFGDLDPGVVLFLARNYDLSTDDLESLLDFANSLSDTHTLTAATASGDRDAGFAIEIFACSIGKTVASYAAVLDGLDMLVFTGGIGEHSPEVRPGRVHRSGFLVSSLILKRMLTSMWTHRD